MFCLFGPGYSSGDQRKRDLEPAVVAVRVRADPPEDVDIDKVDPIMVRM
jgi:hypothetical protein